VAWAAVKYPPCDAAIAVSGQQAGQCVAIVPVARLDGRRRGHGGLVTGTLVEAAEEAEGLFTRAARAPTIEAAQRVEMLDGLVRVAGLEVELGEPAAYLDGVFAANVELLEELERLLSAKNVLGDPIEKDGATIIPIVSFGFGFGAGGQSGEKAGNRAGTGGGGGIRPLGAIIIDGEGARVEAVKGAVSNLAEVMGAAAERAIDRGKPRSDGGSGAE